MALCKINVTVPVGINELFTRISDHANLSEFSAPVKASYLEAAGSPAPNGLGAIRRLRFGGTWMIEKVIAWHPPGSNTSSDTGNQQEIGYDYTVIGGGPPIADHLGTIRLIAKGENESEIQWNIFVKVPLWAGGEIAAKISCASMQRSIGKSVKSHFTNN